MTDRGWRRFPLTMIIGFGALAAMVFGSLLLARLLSNGARDTANALEYGRTINIAAAALRDAEIGQRGYLLTENRSYLAPYETARDVLATSLDEMARIDNPRARAVANRVRPLATQKMAELALTIDLAKNGRRDQALSVVRTNLGKRLADQLLPLLDSERLYVREANLTRAHEGEQASQLLLFGLIIGLVIIVAMALLWLRDVRVQYASLNVARAEAESALTGLKAESEARRSTEAQLRQFQKMESIGQLTGGIAHDFNNMLAVVMGSLELAQRRLRSDPEKVVKHLENAQEGAKRAAALTARLLAFSRQQPLAPKPVETGKLIDGMCEMLNRTLGDAVQVECVNTAGLWRCYADPGEIENAILNLAVNARDAMMPDGGKLTVESINAHIDDHYARAHPDVEPGQYVVICVTDTGNGMSQEVIERAFDPFFTTKGVGKGTGLGLSQVFGFAKQSGGHVAIYSEVGQGTTVKLYLPRFLGTGTAEPDRLDDTTPEGRSGEVILVVEDEQRVRHFAVDVLRELGYTAISAEYPAEALRALEEQPEITMLFTDIVMPDVNGRRLADMARAARPDLKVLFTTGYTHNAVVHNGMLDIGVAFLPKPYNIGELARKVREVLDGRGVNRPV